MQLSTAWPHRLHVQCSLAHFRTHKHGHDMGCVFNHPKDNTHRPAPAEHVFKGALDQAWPQVWPAICQLYVQHCLQRRLGDPEDLDAVEGSSQAARQLENDAEQSW